MSVSTSTDRAPARNKVRAHAETVAPVVSTSSIKQMRRPLIAFIRCGLNAPWTLRARPARLSRPCDGVGRFSSVRFVKGKVSDQTVVQGF